ncbi:MAG: hypothetical protein ACR2GH_05560 [Pseudonocardia sp.]
MEQRLTWLSRECSTGKTCAGRARHSRLPGMSILQGYLINDPEVLADLGVPPQGKAT